MQILVGMHPNYVLLEIVKSRPFFVRVSTLCGRALKASSPTIDFHFVYALQVPVEIIDRDEALCSRTSWLGTSEWLLMFQHMLFVIGRTFGFDAANVTWV